MLPEMVLRTPQESFVLNLKIIYRSSVPLNIEMKPSSIEIRRAHRKLPSSDKICMFLVYCRQPKLIREMGSNVVEVFCYSDTANFVISALYL